MSNVLGNVLSTSLETFALSTLRIRCILFFGSLISEPTSLLIISEGKQKMVVLAAVVSNIVNLLFDFVFIYYGKMAMIGGAIATLIG